MSALVSTDWLASHLREVRLVDASWHMPAEGRDAKAEFLSGHLPGAVFLDIDCLSDPHSAYPHMLPDASVFASAMDAVGIRNDDHVVIYDANGIFSAPRLWWMLRVFGHRKVKVLNGGLPLWRSEGRPLEEGEAQLCPATGYQAQMQPHLLRTFEQMQQNVSSPNERVVDARSAARFNGQVAEPRAGLRSGHIPGSLNLPFAELLMPPHQVLRSRPELEAMFLKAGLEKGQPCAVTCGSGVTACILALALYELGQTDVAVYDGSWAEWGARVSA